MIDEEEESRRARRARIVTGRRRCKGCVLTTFQRFNPGDFLISRNAQYKMIFERVPGEFFDSFNFKLSVYDSTMSLVKEITSVPWRNTPYPLDYFKAGWNVVQPDLQFRVFNHVHRNNAKLIIGGGNSRVSWSSMDGLRPYLEGDDPDPEDDFTFTESPYISPRLIMDDDGIVRIWAIDSTNPGIGENIIWDSNSIPV